MAPPTGWGSPRPRARSTADSARTATDAGAAGAPGRKKDLFAIWAAHRPAYAATVIGSEPLDLARKVEAARTLRGPKLILALAPCPTGWDFDPAQMVEVGRLAVRSGVWPLKEFVDGRTIHTKVPHQRVPVEEYLKIQGRFRHLFEPHRKEELLAEIQAGVDAYWASIE